MAISPFDPVDEDRSNAELEKAKQLLADAQARVNPDIAKQVSSIYKQAPYVPASVILAMAKSGTSQAALDAIKPAAIKQAAADLDPQKPKKESWFERTVWDKVKSVSRWTFASLNLVPDLVQNAAAEAFSPNDPAGMDGFFKSTQLGSMLADSQDTGDGFFIGGAAAKNQAQRARETRGTINGHAWTIGRGAASVAFTPGSVAYNVMSGFLDAAVAVGTDPTNYLGPQIAAARKAKAALPGLTTDAEKAAARLLASGEAGLESAEAAAFNQSKFGRFVTTDRRAQRVVNKLVGISADTSASIEKRTRQILEEFNYNISPEIAREFAQADSIDKVYGLLGEASSKLANAADDVLLPKDIREFRAAGATSKLFDDVAERSPLFRSMRNSKWWTSMPKNTVVVNGTGLDRSKAVQNYSNYLVGIGIEKGSQQFDEAMDVVTKAYSITGAGEGRAAIQDAFDKVFEIALTKAGGNKQLAQKVVSEARQRLADARAFNIDEIGWADDGGFIQAVREMVPEEVFNKFPPDTWDRLVLQGPGALVELADEVHVLPDFRQMRTLMSNPFVRKALANKEGEQRGALAITEFVQNEVWKPLALATGGYIMRNMIDAQTRIAMSGLGRRGLQVGGVNVPFTGIFTHPQDYILWALNKKGYADIRGVDFDIDVANTASRWNVEQQEFQEALTFNTYKNLEDTGLAQEKMMRNGNFSLVNRGVDADAHTTGYVDNLGQLNADPINQRLSRLRLEGLNDATRRKRIKEWLLSEEGAPEANRLREYFKIGIRYTDPESGKVGYIKLGDDVADDVLVEWVDKLSNFKVNTIVRDDNELRIVAGYNKVPLTRVDKTGKTVAVAPYRMTEDELLPRDLLTGADTPGNLVNLGDDTEGLILARRTIDTGEIDPFTGKPMEPKVQYVVQPVHKGDAFEGALGSKALRDLVDAKGGEGKLAQVVKRAERGVPEDPNVRTRALKAKDRFVDFFFSNLYGKATQVLEKSPVFRQYYYREVFDNLDELSPEAARQLITNLTEIASKEGLSIDKYVGRKNALQSLNEVASRVQEQVDIINPSLMDREAGFVFHGTAMPLPEGGFADPLEIDLGDIDNLFGRGIYLTNEPKVAVSYTAKNAKRAKKKTVNVDGVTVAPEGAVYKIQISQNARFIDLTKPSPVINDIIRRWANTPMVQSAVDDANNSLDDVIKLLDSPKATGEQVMGAFKAALVGTRKSFADEVAFDISLDIAEQADGLKYRGGVRRGGLGEHDAFVVLNNKVISVADSFSPVGTKAIGATGTVEQLDQYAKSVAVRQTKELLYNATERNNLEDVLRVVVPFGPAWKEVLGTYAGLLIEDPSRIRRAQLIFDGARKFDPDGDGEGFFYKDPTSGEYSFNFPLSGAISKLLTGGAVEAPLQAPVKRLSIGLGVIPSIGPVAQIAASKLIPDTPSTDFITNILLPYGRTEGINLVPRWATRLKEVVEANQANLQTTYGNTYIETLRALSTTGEYDLSDPNEQERLYADARNKARIIAGMRALGTFFGPTSPAPEFKIDTIQGDIYGTQLVKEFQKLQDPNQTGADGRPGNYDTAVQRFLEIFGNDALLYLSNKTESVAGGLEATEQFSDWQRNNKDLFKKYPEVAGFMAPGGDDFSFEAWSRQVRQGLRRRLTDREIVAAAQFKIASAQYSALRDKLPAKPSKEQKAWLRNWRVELNKQYPAFPVVAEFNPAEFPNKIEKMRLMVQESSLADNEPAQALTQYLEARDKALASAAAGGYNSLQSDAAAPLRDWLSDIGRALKDETPEFSRIYDRLLKYEVEE